MIYSSAQRRCGLPRSASPLFTGREPRAAIHGPQITNLNSVITRHVPLDIVVF